MKRLLKKYGYPPDKTVMATDLILEQAELLSEQWVEEDLDNKYVINNNLGEMAIAEKKTK